ncbi:MAG: hypothetical protein K5Q68_15205 [Roseococcus sp.]|nr:hypothetical protein [Roseococcus sp.]
MRPFRLLMIGAVLGFTALTGQAAQAQHWNKPGYAYAPPPPVYYVPPRPVFVPPPPIFYAPPIFHAPPRPRYYAPPVYYAPRPFHGRPHWHGRRW